MILVIATHNTKKAGEMLAILSRRFPNFIIKTLADYPGAPEPDEIGETYADNAILKSESAANFTGEVCIADDAGLEIDALDGAPGLKSKRFGGQGLPFAKKIEMILELMRGVPEENRTARFRCCVAVADGSVSKRLGQTMVFEAICDGEIATAPSGAGGFGYDPIFYLPERGCCMADLAADQKHAISHRGKVLKEAGDWLDTILATQ